MSAVHPGRAGSTRGQAIMQVTDFFWGWTVWQGSGTCSSSGGSCSLAYASRAEELHLTYLTTDLRLHGYISRDHVVGDLPATALGLIGCTEV